MRVFANKLISDLSSFSSIVPSEDQILAIDNKTFLAELSFTSPVNANRRERSSSFGLGERIEIGSW